jgi:exodeoxyribonuclease VII small subunit
MRYFPAFSTIPIAQTPYSAPAFMAKPPSKAAPASFEASLAELEAIVRDMEAGQLPLEESLAAYERGAALLKHCQEALGAAEQKLKILENGALHDFEPAPGKAAPEEPDA